MKILIDAMGGDHAPNEILRGAVLAADEFSDISITLIGRTDAIAAAEKEAGLCLSEAGIGIIHAEDAVTMEENPLSVRTRKDCSVRRGCELTAAGEYDAFVSAGNTGAVFTAASLFIGRIPGVQRGAIAAILPFHSPLLLLDAGANVQLTPEQILTFALLGNEYAKNIFAIESPRIGLLNIGTEEYKGAELQKESYQLLRSRANLQFVGNVEGKGVPFGVCDVLVTDGFTGNILLKTIEGMGRYLGNEMKQLLIGGSIRKLAAPVYMREAERIKKSLDASEYGGAPILGIRKPLIKAHGSSMAYDIRSAVKQAIRYHESGMIAKLTEEMKKIQQSDG